MSVLVFVESAEGAIKKSSLEAVSYGAALAAQVGGSVQALACGTLSADTLAQIGTYGAQKVWHVADARLDQPVIQAYASVLAQAVNASGATYVVFAKSSLTDAFGARTAAKLRAGLATNVVALPDTSAGFVVKRSIYTGKAFSYVNVQGDIKLLAVKKNAASLITTGSPAAVEALSVSLSDADFGVKNLGTQKATGEVLLPEAEVVISGGRGLKGPENWHLVETLAKTLGAATACSKPVSDMHWRPHHEHVGQTGIKVSPNLYIAIGISGAIQHVAGIASSKVIVAINSDPEAPIFKVADYGIVGDAFQIVPKLTEAFAEAVK